MRNNDRFLAEIPVEMKYHDKTYYGKTADVSETGMSVLFDESVYMPYGDETVDLFLKTDRYESRIRGRSVQVREKNGKWRYGIQIIELTEENKASYFQMLYDHHHSLANVIGKSVSVFDDIFLNIHRRTDKGIDSRRKLPRVELNLVLKTLDGRTVRALNCNYEYILLEEDSALGDRICLILPGTKKLMKCKNAGQKAGLYIIENWKEVLDEGAFELLFHMADKKNEEAKVKQG